MVSISEDKEQIMALLHRATYYNVANTSIMNGTVCCAIQMLIADGCSSRCPLNNFGVMSCSKYIKILKRLV